MFKGLLLSGIEPNTKDIFWNKQKLNKINSLCFIKHLKFWFAKEHLMYAYL